MIDPKIFLESKAANQYKIRLITYSESNVAMEKKVIMYKQKQKAFTLIELLVVISIIALLMAILMPSLQRTRDQAKTVVCQTQLKQWGIVFLMYTGDNNGYFHRGHRGSSDFKGNWFNATIDYWQDPAILRCPMAKVQKGGSQRGDGGKFTAWSSWLGSEDTIVAGAYAINGWVQNPPPGEDTKGHDSRNNWRTFYAKTAHPVPLLLDSWWYYGYPYETDTPTEWEGQIKAGEHGMDKFCIDRHRNGTINGLFLDQSVRQVRLKRLWRFKWHKSYNVNTPPPNWATEAPWMVGLPE